MEDLNQLEEYRILSIDELKELWDTCEYLNDPGGDSNTINYELVHQVLNEKGAGEYCEV